MSVVLSRPQSSPRVPSAMFTRFDPSVPEDRGPSMMQRHAEHRERELAREADDVLAREFPLATRATRRLALDGHDGDAALARDALREFFALERDREQHRGESSDRRRARASERSGEGKLRDGDGDERATARGKDRKRERKHRSRSRSRSRSRRGKRDRKHRSRSRSREELPRQPERAAFGDDEAERRRELADARARAAEAKQREIIARMRASGETRDALREQNVLRARLQIAHRQGDAREVERLRGVLARDDALERAAKDNFGFRPHD